MPLHEMLLGSSQRQTAFKKVILLFFAGHISNRSSHNSSHWQMLQWGLATAAATAASAVLRQTAVAAAYLKSKQLLLFAFAGQNSGIVSATVIGRCCNRDKQQL